MNFKKTWLIFGTLALSFSLMGSASAETNPETTMDLQVQQSDIRYYETLSDSPEEEKKKGLLEHKEAIELVTQHMKKHDSLIEVDFDNVDYQKYVISLAFAFDFNDEDNKKVVNFAKFMDWYENYGKNEKIKDYEKKLSQRAQLSTEEIIDLDGLLPIQDNAPTTVDDGLISTTSSPEEETASTFAVSANGYNNIAARDYAYNWWNGRNTVYSTYYAEKVGGCNVSDGQTCWNKWNDCANFVSQALYAGGMKFKYGASFTSDESWNFGSLIPSHTWGGAHNFYKHWKTRAGVASTVSDLQTGDAVSLNTDTDADIDHTVIITKNTGNSSANKYITQHSWDHKEERTLADMFSEGYGVYGYEIDKATN
ncbi:amidase domain-containing protein [Paenibacillus vandeheii]|uniref:amidase domain-containing protein n=1 Tax=Paenibacillus vandeheii TaxID=3035917 RepID=UPI00263A4327|nr:amidase domain-containing protein [Paenibacillus vandeheii]